MRILITGGSGFIGQKLTEALLEQGHTVRILTRGDRESGDDRVSYIKADYFSVSSLAAAADGCDAVYHLAACLFATSYEEFARANITLTQNLVKACNSVQTVKRFIMVSSLAAAGYAPDLEHPVTEENIEQPVSDYGLTKRGGERAVETLDGRIERVILRPPIVYGKNDSGISKIAAWVRRGVMVNTTSGEAYFSFVYVEDLVKALLIVLKDPRVNGQTYFICENKFYDWKSFINEMAAAMGKRGPVMLTLPLPAMKAAGFIYSFLAKIFKFEPALNYDKVTEASVKGHWICSSAKWTDLTGQVFTPLKEGLKKSFGK